MPKPESIFPRKVPRPNRLAGRALGVGVLLLLPFLLLGQKKYTMLGIAQGNYGTSYPYFISFETSGSSLTGYSITKQPDGAEFKAEIKGHINRKEHTLAFTETKSLDKDADKKMTICLFDAKLTYKLLGTKYEVSGTFTGTDLNNQPCSKGTMTFEQPNNSTSPFYVEKKAPPPPAPKPDTVVKKEPVVPQVPANTITAGVQKHLDWNTDSCIIDVWDGGIIDGDVVTILLNDKPVLTKYTLVKARKQLRLPLEKSITTIAIVAEDEGLNPPNTAEISLHDGDTDHKITAFNNKGEKATIVIEKRHSK